MLQIAIADDEVAARQRLTRLIGTQSGYTIVGEFSDGESAISGIRALKPDVAILDIQMPERDGLEVARAIASPGGPAILFVTGFDQYALRAFDVHAVDYLVKPVDADRLHETLARVTQRPGGSLATSGDVARLARMLEDVRTQRCGAAVAERWRPLDRLLVPAEGRSLLVPAEQIDWIEASGNYVRLHCGPSAFMMRESLASVEASLDAHLFARVHRGALVNIGHIKEVQPWFSGAAILILNTGQRLTLSRSFRRDFEDRFRMRSDL